MKAYFGGEKLVHVKNDKILLAFSDCFAEKFKNKFIFCDFAVFICKFHLQEKKNKSISCIRSCYFN